MTWPGFSAVGLLDSGGDARKIRVLESSKFEDRSWGDHTSSCHETVRPSTRESTAVDR